MTVLDKRNLPTEQIERILEDAEKTNLKPHQKDVEDFIDKWFENFEDKPYISDPDYEI
jgi:hypothetical protein